MAKRTRVELSCDAVGCIAQVVGSHCPGWTLVKTYPQVEPYDAQNPEVFYLCPSHSDALLSVILGPPRSMDESQGAL